jgi:hypothetical protein
LERLPTGLSKGAYRPELEERGYKVLDSAKKDDRTQFRVTKNGREALVHVRFDDDTGRAAQVNAFPLLINAASLQHSSQSLASSSYDSYPSEMRQTLYELEQLPVSRDRSFYRQALRQRGFQITDTDINQDRTQFEAEKDGHRITLDVQFDEDTGKSTNVEALSRTDTQKDGRQMSQAKDMR